MSTGSLSSNTSNSDKKRSTESLPSHSYTSTAPLADSVDKSTSQPNITVPSVSQSALCLSASVLPESPPDNSEVEVLAAMAKDVKPPEPQQPCTDDLAQDIDTVLAEVMSGLESLQMKMDSTKTEQEKTVSAPTAKPRNTPDLVQDLPVTSHLLSPSENSYSMPEDTCSMLSLSTAEVFADSNQSTIKKGSLATMPRSNTALSSFMTPLAPSTETFSPMKRSFTTNAKIRAHAHPTRTRRERYSDPSDVIVPEIGGASSAVDATTDADKPVWIGRTAENDPSLMASRPVAQPRPKPPVRVKPQVMKKPARSPEIMKRLRGRKEGGEGVERSTESPP